MSLSICLRSLIVLSVVTLGFTHSWIEQLRVVSNGVLIDPPGYPRGNGKIDHITCNASLFSVLCTPSFRDDDMTYRLPPAGRELNEIWAGDLACKESQITSNQTAGSPSLMAHSNDTLMLLY
jgi:hypothetical protein